MSRKDDEQAARTRARTRRADATGRSAERRRMGFGGKSGLETPFFPLSRRLMESVAFCALGVHAFRVLMFLGREHMRQGGLENGKLAAPYRQLVAANVNKRDCFKGIEQLIAYGLIIRTRDGGRLGGRDQPALYRITFLHDHMDNPPTNEWADVTEAQIEAWEGDRKVEAALKRQRRATAKSHGNIEGAHQTTG